MQAQVTMAIMQPGCVLLLALVQPLLGMAPEYVSIFVLLLWLMMGILVTLLQLQLENVFVSARVLVTTVI
jgi:hypothetical protein